MSWLHCTGAIHIFARVSANTPIFYVGTSEQHPMPEGETHYAPVFNDIGGPVTKFDVEYQGDEEVVALDLNRFNDGNLSILLSPPFYNGVVGYTSRLARGSLAIQQGHTYELWLANSFYNTPDATIDLPPGTYYPACVTIGRSTPKQGTKTQTKRVVIEPLNWYDPTDGTFWLKSEDALYFQNLPSILSA